jgi:ribosomal protein S21
VIFLDQRQDYSRQGSGERTEPFEVMLRRFFRDIQQSGILTEIKKRRFRERELSREQIRESARRKTARKKIKRGY